MSLTSRIERVERAIAGDYDDGPRGVPEAWIVRDEHGNMIGPSTDANPRAVVTFEQLLAMDATIPHASGQ